MENNALIKSLKDQFFLSFSMLEKIIENCPNELWNSKKSGFVFWQQLYHTFYYVRYWLRDENCEVNDPYKELNLNPELEKEPENILTKDNMISFNIETKEIVEKWFEGKNDDWLKLLFFKNPPYIQLEKLKNNDVIVDQIRHLMYHVGHCEAIFRENKIKTVEYLDYFSPF
jgi:hypothetical protein